MRPEVEEFVATLTKTKVKRLLLSHREIDAGTDCWIWTGHWEPKNNGGRHCFFPGNQQKFYFKAHRLAAWVFLDVPLTGPVFITQTCGCTACIQPEHLVIHKTRSEMMKHLRFTRPQKHWARGERIKRAILDADKVRYIKGLLLEGVKHRVIARDCGFRWKMKISQGCIGAIATGRTWKHVSWPKRAG